MAHLLPSPRDEALAWIGRDIAAFVTGREPKRPARRVDAPDPALFEQIRADLDGDRPAEALTRIDAAWPSDRRMLASCRSGGSRSPGWAS